VLLAGGDDDGSGSEQAAVGPATELPGDLAWQPIDKLPYKRQYAAATAVDDKIWQFGGIRTARSGTGTQAYDPTSNDWATGPGLPLPLHHFSAVNYDGEAVVIGGFIADGEDLSSRQSDAVYALSDGNWEPLPPLNYKRAAAAAAVVGDKIVVVGGQADGKLVPQTEVYDGEGWTVVADIPTPREHLGAASDGRYLYAAGGNDLASDTKSAAFERYDPETNEWTPLDDMPEALKGVGAGFAGGRIVAVGGEDLTAVSDAVYGYDIRGREWSPLPRLPNPRHGVALTEVGDSLYAIGGATAPGHAGPTDAVDLLDLSGGAAAPVPEHDAWRTVGDALSDVQYAATAVDDRIWLFGGIDANGNATAASATYDSVINNWTPQTRLPRPVHHAAAVAYEGGPVVIGGSVAGGATDGVFALRDD
jgi:N-acetylneuraminic acid mutarotase